MRPENRVEPNSEETRSPALAVVRRRWWVIALTTVVALGVAVAGLSMATPTYQGTVTLQLPVANGVQTPTDLTYLDRLMNTYTQLAGQPSLRNQVARQLGGTKRPALSVTVQPNTELLQLSVRDPSPSFAAHAANVSATVLVSRATALAQSGSQGGENAIATQLDNLSNQITALRVQLAQLAGTASLAKRLSLQQAITAKQSNYDALSQQRAQLQLANAVNDQTLTVVQPAFAPSSPVSPRWPPVLALALGLGLLGGLGWALLLERMAPRLYTVEAIESAADADVLAAIPRVSGGLAESRLYNGGSVAQEAFGVLAVHILADANERSLHNILVTSRNKGDGKSTVASNLAVELARSGNRVLLIDADMRSPSVQEIFEINQPIGLSDLLERPDLDALADEFVVHPDGIPNLGIIVAGHEPDAPARLLASRRFTSLLDGIGRYDYVIIDAPPLVVSDPLSVARHADLVLLVLGGDAVPDRDIQAATRQLSSIGARHVSVVVNRWRGHEASYSYEYRK